MTDYKSLLEKIDAISQSWNSNIQIPDNLFGIFKDLSKSDVASSLKSLRLKLEEAEESKQTLSPLFFAQILNQMLGLESVLQQHMPANPTAHLPGFINNLFYLIASIEQAVVSIDSKAQYSYSSMKLKERLRESIARAEVVNDLLNTTHELISSNKLVADEITRNLSTSQDAAVKILERDRTTLESTSRINETEKKSATLLIDLETNLQKVNSSSEEIRKQQNELQILSGELKTRLNEAQSLLEDANRYGLAGAFKTRKEQLFWPSVLWIFLFFVSTISLTVFGLNALNAGNTDWHLLLLRLPLTVPLVWLGWFAVKQYGYNAKLQEDYAFKIASAMSFQGYKNEVASDPQTLEYLRRSAVENFSQNPLRIYTHGTNHGSPLNELLDSVSEEKFSKIVELVKMLSGEKGKKI